MAKQSVTGGMLVTLQELAEKGNLPWNTNGGIVRALLKRELIEYVGTSGEKQETRGPLTLVRLTEAGRKVIEESK